MKYQFRCSVFLAMAFVVTLACHCGANGEFENLVRRNIPSGFSLLTFVEICENCGELYGKDFTYRCLADKSGSIFKGCKTAVMEKR